MYPKIMTAGPWQSVVVANEEQERALPKEYGGLASGETMKEEEIVEPVNIVEPADKTKEELQAECDASNIKYDKRWGVEKLLEALA